MAASQHSPGPSSFTRFSLAELVMVLAVVSIVAALGLPDLSRTKTTGLDAAADEVAEALRFARNEALRSENPHGIEVTPDHRVRVFTLDTSIAPSVKRFNVRHPLDQSLYDVDLFGGETTEGSHVSADFQFLGSGTPQFDVAFDNGGEPVATTNLKALISGSVLITHRGFTRIVDLGPLTGRVRVQ